MNLGPKALRKEKTLDCFCNLKSSVAEAERKKKSAREEVGKAGRR